MKSAWLCALDIKNMIVLAGMFVLLIVSQLFARKKLWLWYVLKWPCAVDKAYKSKN